MVLGLIWWIAIFVLSLAVLVKASDYFTDYAEKVGLALGIPAFLTGVTIVAIGTSLPELISSVFAVLAGSTEFVVGNVIGSNIANIFLVLGIAAIIGRKLKISYELIHVDLPLLVASAFLFTIAIWDGVFSLFEAILFLIAFAIYMLYTIRIHKKGRENIIKKELRGEIKREKIGLKIWTVLIISAAFIFLGAKFTVDSVIQIAQILNIGAEVIAVTAVALGTSLPEVFVSFSAARKGKSGIAVGNILGSNIFNTLAVMGFSGLIAPLIIPTNLLLFALPVMIMATLLYYFITQDKEITLWEGWFAVVIYVLFIAKIFNLF